MSREAAKGQRHKCGPRVKTGCTTCRIRRVKCDEGKPSCRRCTDTGRKCDGYVALPLRKQHQPFQADSTLSITAYELPFSIPGSQQDRKLFHFYCTKSAVDLSGFITDDFWYNVVLQQSQVHNVVRQAVLAFSASHLHHMTRSGPGRISAPETNEQAHRELYYKAIRSLRRYLSAEKRPDPRVASICCALFFCYENAVGDSSAALKHLESGIQVLKGCRQPLTVSDNDVSHPRPASPLIEDELVHLFARFDLQATLFDTSRPPSLRLAAYSGWSKSQEPETATPFGNISECQQQLDVLFSRLSHLLVPGVSQKFSPLESLPEWILEEKKRLEKAFFNFEDALNGIEKPLWPKDNGSHATETRTGSSAEQHTLRIKLCRIHFGVCSMFLRSSYPFNPDVFTATPNDAADEILRLCSSVADVICSSESEAAGKDTGFWRLSSEMGILAPLFMLAVKCGDLPVRRGATEQIRRLHGYKEGLFDADVLAQFLDAAERYVETDQDAPPSEIDSPKEQWEEYIQWPEDENLSTSEVDNPLTTGISLKPLEESLQEILDEPGGLPVWSQNMDLVLGDRESQRGLSSKS